MWKGQRRETCQEEREDDDQCCPLHAEKFLTSYITFEDVKRWKPTITNGGHVDRPD